MKEAAAEAYAAWKAGVADWHAVVTAETAFDSAVRLPVSSDRLLNSGGARTARNQVTSAVANGGSANVVPATTATGVVQAPQQTNYYCGPAAAYEVLEIVGYGKSRYNGAAFTQSSLASSTYLQTDALGQTPWSGPAVMAPTLNLWIYGQTIGFYAAQAAPSQASVQNDVTTDIDGNHPLALNIHETASGSTHLSGYPTDKTVDHWVAIWAYDQSGATLSIADPAYSSAVSWRIAMGQPYRWISSSQTAALAAPHGIVW